MKGKKKKSVSVSDRVSDRGQIRRHGEVFVVIWLLCEYMFIFFCFFFSMRDTRVCSNVDGRDPEGESFVMSNRWNYLGGKWYGI